MKRFLALLLLVVIAACGRTLTFDYTTTPSSRNSIEGVVSDNFTPIPGVTVTLTSSALPGPRTAITDAAGRYSFVGLPSGEYRLTYQLAGFATKRGTVRVAESAVRVNVALSAEVLAESITVTAEAPSPNTVYSVHGGAVGGRIGGTASLAQPLPTPATHLVEEYTTIHENKFVSAEGKPLSTFSIDVDRASYSNVRRFIAQGQMPPADAVRIEEMLNYFRYNYPAPAEGRPFSITTEVATCPWAPNNRLMLVGLQGRVLEPYHSPPNNLVFLLDVSGSMDSPERLPLVKQSLHMLVDELRGQDQVSIVVYAGAAGLVLPPTSGNDKDLIQEALGRLRAGGSTAGAAGIQLAYEVAKENFIEGGNNRVILATDGDFNVGLSSVEDLEKLIESKRNDGIFLTALGFGMGNYKDNRLETLADKGNGNYAYIDNLFEARKVLVEELGGTLYAIAKDVKIQVEFDPLKVESYRLIGYEDRLLRDEDFVDDSKDAGELGSGHSVTALYEIVPRGDGRIATVNLRYKHPNATTSAGFNHPVVDRGTTEYEASEDWRFAAAVSQYGMLLRGSEHRGKATYESVLRLARMSQGVDAAGYRGAFIELIQQTTPLVQVTERAR